MTDRDPRDPAGPSETPAAAEPGAAAGSEKAAKKTRKKAAAGKAAGGAGKKKAAGKGAGGAGKKKAAGKSAGGAGKKKAAGKAGKKAAGRASAEAPPATPGTPVREPTDEEIRRRAYELHEKRGGGHGLDREDWHRAERELREEYSRRNPSGE